MQTPTSWPPCRLLVVGLLAASIEAPGHAIHADGNALRPTGARSEVKLVLDDHERAVIDDVKDGRFATLSFADAALIASGVTDSPRRLAYLRRLAELETEASKALGAATTPLEKGEKLLAWLHGDSGPLAAAAARHRPKYVARQTNLHTLLDTGTYNCVSATVIYNLIGRRLGLDLRAIEVPTHVFSVLHVGEQRVDIETTTARGFNPSRDKSAVADFEQLTGFTYIPARSRKKQREIHEAALISTIFYNRGVDALRLKRHSDGFRFSVLALRLDPLATSAAGNAETALARWAGDVARDGDMNRARDIVDQNVGWLKDPGVAEKVLLIVYQSRAQHFSKAGDWRSVADLYVSALDRHRGNEKLAGRLERSALAAYDSWTQPMKKRGQWQEAVVIYEQGLKALGNHKHLQRQLKLCQQRGKMSSLQPSFPSDVNATAATPGAGHRHSNSPWRITAATCCSDQPKVFTARDQCSSPLSAFNMTSWTVIARSERLDRRLLPSPPHQAAPGAAPSRGGYRPSRRAGA